MHGTSRIALCVAAVTGALVPFAGLAQMAPMDGMVMPKDAAPAVPRDAVPAMPQDAVPAMPKDAVPAVPRDAVPAMDPAMNMDAMQGAFGLYGMSREASGTSWQPDASPQDGVTFGRGQWRLMAHGYADAIYDSQGGPRGADKSFSASMAMLMAQRPVGQGGTFGLRAMMSLDPLMGASGYPLLLATGETADGRTPLVDRQHPHDLFMELSASYSQALDPGQSVFFYAGLPGEPALGPPAFMHRLSGMDSPEAPITHHWLDSTHITYGVLTAGYVRNDFKVEASLFRGREPNQERFDIEAPQLDSVAVRLSYNPSPYWSGQVSGGYLKSPEQLLPGTDERRVTASATHTLPFGGGIWSTTFAWGRKMNRPGRNLDGFLLESELVLHRLNTIFLRAERVDEDELYDLTPQSPLLGQSFTVGKLSLGYIRDFDIAPHVVLGAGLLVSRYAFLSVLDAAYGNPASFMLFLRLKVG